MASSAELFQQQLGAQVAALLGGKYKFFKSRLELRAEAPDGHNVIILSGSNKWSPHISLSFYFGRNFSDAKRVEKLLGEHQFYYHIQQYSLNRESMQGLTYRGPYTWSVDITAPPDSLASEVVAAIHGIADPFFERFATIKAARDALAADDPWCFGGKPFWSQLLLLDLAMGNQPHFERWAERLDDFTRSQVDEKLSKYRAAAPNVV